MKRISKRALPLRSVAACALGLFLAASEVLAAENASSWRPTYDLVLMWVNFGIIVFIIVKYARKPLVNFLKGQKEEVDRKLTRLKKKKKKARLKSGQPTISLMRAKRA